MLVAFFHSGDGGVLWNSLPTKEFSGTGGGAFDPLSTTDAYLAYGLVNSPGKNNLYRVTNEGRTMTSVGRLPCNSVYGLVFTSVANGLAACQVSSTQSTDYLLRTSNGGATWRKVSLG